MAAEQNQREKKQNRNNVGATRSVGFKRIEMHEAFHCPLECIQESVSHWEWGGLGGLVRALGVVSVVATSHTGPSVKPSRGRVVALSVGCGSS